MKKYFWALFGATIICFGPACNDDETSSDGGADTNEDESEVEDEEPVEDDEPTEEAECGDATVEGDEECDDGNTTDGDGCSSVCMNEAEDTVDVDAICGLDPCGGSLANTSWKSVGACPEEANPVGDAEGAVAELNAEWQEACPGASIVLDYAEFRVMFGNTTASYEIANSRTYTLPADCLEIVPDVTTCEDIAQDNDTEGLPEGATYNKTCSGSVDTSCTCTVTITQSLGSDVAYSVDGSNITTNGATSTFCVDGDNMASDTDGNTIAFVRM